MRRLAPLFLLFFAGCRQQDVQYYEVAKESDPAAGLTALMQSAPSESAPMPQDDAQSDLPLRWKVPAGWQASAGSGMRLASFAFEGADISVVAIPGEAGGDLANVNRWRGQLGLPPIAEKELASASMKIKSGAGPLLVVDFTGTDPKGEIQGKARLLGAILALDDKQWFFKAMGADPAIAKAKPSFMSFLRSLKRASNS